MTKLSASEAKTHFGALIDQAQSEPVTTERQGRPVAVVLSYAACTEPQQSSPSAIEREKARRFLNKWAKRPRKAEVDLAEDPLAQAIWEEYSRSE